eukprot:PhF_6_TR26206/c0_g1_i1/m.37331
MDVNGFNVYEYLCGSQPTFHDLNPTLMLLSVVKYEGEFDPQGRFHGYGKLISSMNYSYEGEFKAGMMHGKGRIEWSDGTSYDGEFVENRITGKGTYTMTSGDVYTGDVFQGQRHGNGQYKQAATGYMYEGDWELGVKKGKGTMYYKEDLSTYYRGQWDNNLPNGKGIMVYASGSVFDGEFLDGEPHGTGNLVVREQGVILEEYRGQWVSGRPHGNGSSLYITPHNSALVPLEPMAQPATKETTINRYDGEFQNGLRHGRGTFQYQDGSKYEGQWDNNQKEGEGRFTHPNGTVYFGKFEKGKLVTTLAMKLSSEVNATTQSTAQGGSTHKDKDKDNSAGTQSAVSSMPSQVILYIEDLLLTAGNPDEVMNGIQSLLSRHYGALRRIFQHYCSVEKSVSIPSLTPREGNQPAPQTMAQMTVAQFWTFLADCQLLNHDLTIAIVDRILTTLRERCSVAASKLVASVPSQQGNAPAPPSVSVPSERQSITTPPTLAPDPSPRHASIQSQASSKGKPRKSSRDSTSTTSTGINDRSGSRAMSIFDSAVRRNNIDIHNGKSVLTFRDFVEALVRVAYQKYSHVVTSDISRMLQVCLEDIIIVYACNPNTSSLWKTTKDVSNVLATHQPLLESIFSKYQQHAYHGLDLHLKSSPLKPDSTITVRQFLALLRDCGCIDNQSLTLVSVLNLIDHDHKEKKSDVCKKVEKRLLLPSTGVLRNASSVNTEGVATTATDLLLSVTQQGDSADVVSERIWERKLQTERDAAGYKNTNVTNTLAVDVELIFAEYVESLAKVSLAKFKDVVATPAQKFEMLVNKYLKNLM